MSTAYGIMILAAACVSAQAQPDLTISKTHVGNFVQGTNGTHTIVVSNVGVASTSGTVTVTDLLPIPAPAMSLVSATGTNWTCIGTTLITCTSTQVVAAGGSYPPISLVLNFGISALSGYINQANVSGGGETNTSNNSAFDTTVVLPPLLPDLTISKTHVGNFVQGTTGTHTIVVTNIGVASTSGTVTVTDVTPAGTTFSSASGTGWTCTNGAGTTVCTSTQFVAPGGSLPPISLVFNIPISALSGYTNTANVSGGGESNTANNSAFDTTVVLAPADLTISKSHAGNFTAGNQGVYGITVTNVGTASTSGTVTVTDLLPGGMTLASFTGSGWTCIGSTTISCTSTQTVVGGSSFPVINLTVNVPADAPASLTNTATVAGGGEFNTANNTVNDPTTIIPVTDLTISKSHKGNLIQGQIGAAYSIIVTNQGPSNTSGTTTVVDVLPAGLSATAISGSGWTCVLATLTCTSTAAIAPGSSFPVITVTVNVATNSPLSVTNSANVASPNDPNNSNNAANDPTTFLPLDFLVRYAANLTSGDAVINITNTGANGAALAGPGFGGAAGNICMNVYAFSPDEQLVSCCSCLITPNGLVSLSVNQDLVNNTLTGVRPNSVVVKLVNTLAGDGTGASCTNSAALAGSVAFPTAGGSMAFGTTVHVGAAGSFPVAETPFLKATLSPAELASITNRCTNIIGNGSTFGICRSCRGGGLAAGR